MATIEPRLIHLLNDSSTPHLGYTDLRPPTTTPIVATQTQTSTLSAATAPVPTLTTASGSSLVSSATTLLSSSSSPPPPDTLCPLPSLHYGGGGGGGPRSEGTMPKGVSAGGGGLVASLYSPTYDEGLGLGITNDCNGIGTGALRLKLPATTFDQASNYLSKILDGYAPRDSDFVSRLLEDGATKKRRAITVRDDVVQLPQPVKKQKALSQAMPPIINGLLEPPHQESLLPPISEDASQLKMLREYPPVQQPDAYAETDKDKASSALLRGRKKSSRPRRKWTEGETRHLLLGVKKHGVGRWSLILEDSDFSFNDRSAGDLKDRFRTCCPNELRRKISNKRSQSDDSPLTPTSDCPPKFKLAGIMSESLLRSEALGEKDGNAAAVQAPPPPQDTEFPITDGPPAKLRKTRAHRKNMEDLAELGIHGPFKKSRRRERRPFTEQDDRNILQGLDKYGPAWTKIQRDGRLNLSSRQPTDLRDRVRNKHPEVYQRIEKGWWTLSKDATTPASRTDIMEPSVNMFIDTMGHNTTASSSSKPIHHSEQQLPRTSSKDDLSKWPHGLVDVADSPVSGHTFDFVAETPAPAGDMDISRLLLDDSQLSYGSR